MKYTKFALTALVVTSCLSFAAYAESPPEKPLPPPVEKSEAGNTAGGPRSEKFEKRGREMFEKTDADKDGFLTLEEMEAGHRARMEEMFKKTDADGDGKLSPDELNKGREQMREKFRERFKERKEEYEKEHHHDKAEDKSAE